MIPAATTDPVSDLAETAARSAGQAAAGQLLQVISTWILDGVVWTVRAVFGFFEAATTPDLTASWFSGVGSPYVMTVQLAALLMIGFALLAITHGILTGDVGGAVRTLTVRAPAGVLAMVATVGITQTAVIAVDAVAAGFLQRFSQDSEDVAYALQGALPSTDTTPSFAVVALGIVAVIAGLVVIAELVVRSALLYLIVALAPLVFAAQVWPVLRGASRRLLELLAALVLSKLAIAIALAVAGAAIASPLHPTAGDSSAAATAGVLLAAAAAFGVAAFSPFLIHRLLPLTEAAVVAQGTSSAPVRAGRAVLATTSTAAATSHRLGALAGGGAASSSARSAPTPGADLSSSGVASPVPTT